MATGSFGRSKLVDIHMRPKSDKPCRGSSKFLVTSWRCGRNQITGRQINQDDPRPVYLDH